MRIVEVNAYYHPYRGGIEQRVNNISKRLAKRHEVIVLTSQLPGTSPEEVIDGCRVLRLESKFRLVNTYNPPYVDTPGLLRRLNSLDADVVDFHYRWAPSYASATRRYEGRKVFTYHNTFGEGAGVTRPLSFINDTLWKRPVRSCNLVVCVSEFVRRDLAERGFDARRLIAVPNGVEITNHFEPKEDDFILFVGRLVATKGLTYLIKAMRNVESKLIVCGEGPETKRLKRLIARYSLEKRVELAGRVTSERRDRLMSTCQMFIMPSVFESYGIAVAEAMSYGRPIVASDVGGLPEVVQDAGLLFPPRDAAALSDRINQLLSDPGRRRAMGMRAHELSERFSWDRAAAEMERVYSNVAAS